jgi:hypothetical protein
MLSHEGISQRPEDNEENNLQFLILLLNPQPLSASKTQPH